MYFPLKSALHNSHEHWQMNCKFCNIFFVTEIEVVDNIRAVTVTIRPAVTQLCDCTDQEHKTNKKSNSLKYSLHKQLFFFEEPDPKQNQKFSFIPISVL